jgi:small ubiquitin-related modifier
LQDKGEVYFKIRKTTPLKKLMEAYCDKQGIAIGSTRFMFDEKRLNAAQTAEQVNIGYDPADRTI